MQFDNRGLPISTSSANAAAAYDHLVTGYVTQRADTPARLTALLEADPDFALAHCMQGYFAMMTYKQATIPTAMEAPTSGKADPVRQLRRLVSPRACRAGMARRSRPRDNERPYEGSRPGNDGVGPGAGRAAR